LSYSRYNDVRWDAIAEAVRGLNAHLRVLDLGANDGWLSVRLADLGHDVVAVERTPQRRASLAPGSSGKVEWVERSIRAHELPTLGTFDVVIALSVLHHFRSCAKAWWNLHDMARELVIAEIPDPREGRRPEKVESWQALHDAVLGTPNAHVALWLPGWVRETRRPLVTVHKFGAE
jgi:2-polyprenyl-3-methyl-5-hydroxy-6-metoxy-1,4-benzoquinol methylase